jgi:aminotransferase
MRLKDLLARLQNPQDRFNQYSFPFGLPELREAIADYTARFSGFRPDPETEITVVLGATEGVSSVLRAVCRPGDGVVIVQPFHEMYPSQCKVFGLRPEYVTLRETPEAGRWEIDRTELEEATGRDVRVLILNTPHNPTGKVFTNDELLFIADLCRRHDLLVITDEIYEHILYGSHRHHCLVTFEGMHDRTIVVNSISKTGNATGWRVGWVISPPAYTPRIRGVHDTLVVQAPTPLQKGAERLLRLGDAFYREIRERYAAKCETLITGLRSVGFRVTPPEGSYYLFTSYRHVPALRDFSPMDAALFLIEKVGVASVPGDNFYAVGNEGDGYLRFAFCRSLDTLREAVQRLSRL